MRRHLLGVGADSIARHVVDAGVQVHRALGPGLLEAVYRDCLCYELESRGIRCQKEVMLPVVYREMRIERGYRLDLLAEGVVAVEVKAVEGLLPVHEAQLITYLRLGGWPVGFLMNFHVALMKQGIRRFVSEAYRKIPPRSHEEHEGH